MSRNLYTTNGKEVLLAGVHICDSADTGSATAIALALNGELAWGSAMHEALVGIIGLIGNVDHAKGNGPNSALMRGEMLNDIRAWAVASLAKSSPTPEHKS